MLPNCISIIFKLVYMYCTIIIRNDNDNDNVFISHNQQGTSLYQVESSMCLIFVIRVVQLAISYLTISI